ncbi:MAG: hypothetical protein D6798_11440 [Deltaproteobacteria bacterium]|nr:MAG: hypothetical protein D6798_11440 [Deltaproteobacteria bacterium]
MTCRRGRVRARVLVQVLALFVLGAGPAWSQPVDEAGDPAPSPDEDWPAGLPIAQVSLLAPRGGLPRENLEPLLRVRQGGVLAPDLVRQDIRSLMRAGAFAAVEVDAEPWLAFDDDGEPIDAVRVIYRVYPAPRIDRIRVEVADRAARRVVEASHGLDRGETFFLARDGPEVSRRVRAALIAAGWPDATVDLEVVDVGENLREIRVRAEPGTPRRLDGVVLAADLPLDERRLRRELRRLGIRVGDRIPTAAEGDARALVQRMLAEQGYHDARVTLLFSPAEQGERLAILGEPGPRLEAIATGPGAPHGDRLLHVTGLSDGGRLTPGAIDDATASLRRWLQRRGFYGAQVRARVIRSGDDAVVAFDIDRGPRHRVAGYDIEGAEVLDDSTIRAALEEAAPESLGRRVVVDDDLPAAARALTELYRGQGRLEADVEIGAAVSGRPRWMWPVGRRVPLRVSVRIDEGVGSRLLSLDIRGADPDTAERVQALRGRLVGQPYRPGEIDALRQELVEELRERGYIDADATLRTTMVGDDAVVLIDFQPGEQVRLRSITIQGNQRTRRSVIARELAVEVGQPIRPSDLERTRQRLYDLDLFQAVTLDLIGTDPRSRDLIVEVEERPSIFLQVGGGVATDRGIAARGQLAHRNIAGRGQSLSLVGQGGYTWLGDTWRVDLDNPTWKLSVRYEAPNVPARRQRLVTELLLNDVLQERSWRVFASGFRVGLGNPIGTRDELYLSYGVGWRRLDDIDPGALVAGDPWLAALGLAGVDDPLPDDIHASRLQTGPSLALVVDHRDSPIDPRRGWRTSSLLDVDDGLLSDTVSVRAETRIEGLVALGAWSLSLSGHGGIGWAAGPGTTLPVEDRFVLGGSGSLRGFRPGTVSPANEVPRVEVDLPAALEPLVRDSALVDSPTRWVPTGGDSLVAASVELRAPLSALGLGDFDSTWLVGFVDAGRVGFIDPDPAPTSVVEGRDPPLRYGVGGGLRIATPVGPIAALVGANPARLEERSEPSWVLHFTLGDL